MRQAISGTLQLLKPRLAKKVDLQVNPFQLRRVVFDAGVVGSVVLSKLDDLLSEVDADGGDEVRAEGVVDVLNEAARLADAGVAQHQELDDVIEVERSHFNF